MIERFASLTTSAEGARAAPAPTCYRSPVTGSVRLLAFAGARDILGAAELDLALDAPCSAAELLDRVCAIYPGLVPYKRALRLAVNGSYVAWGDPVTAGDEVALIPPVAGG